MKKLFFITALLLMAMGTIVPSENNESWYQRAKGHLHRGKEHVKKHWKKYATGAAALGLAAAAYSHWNGKRNLMEYELDMQNGGAASKLNRQVEKKNFKKKNSLWS